MSASKEEGSAGDFWGNVLGVVLLVGAAIGFIETHWAVFIILFALLIAGAVAYFHFSSNGYHVKVAWRSAKQEYEDVRAQFQKETRCPPDKVAGVTRKMLERDEVDISQPSTQWFVATVADLYRRDYRGTPFPSFPTLEGTRDTVHVAQVVEEARATLEYAQQEASRLSLTIDLVRDVAAGPWEFMLEQDKRGPVMIRMFDLVPDIRDMVTSMSAHFFLPKYWDVGVGEWLRSRYLRNVRDATLQSKTESEIERSGNVVPEEFVGTAQEVIETYLGGTPLLELFSGAVPLSFRQQLRYEHGVIVAGTGGGKTQLLEAFVLADLDDDDPPGVIVIDSKGEMVERISRLEVFHPEHGRLKDRLIVIKHTDKPALNLFDVEPDMVEQRFSQIESLMKYFFGSLFDSKTSDQMDTLLIPLLHIVLRMEGATLRTLIELVRNPQVYPEMLDRIPPDTRDFIVNHFKDPFYSATKSALITRLSRLAQDASLGAMFTTPHNSVDLGQALNEGKIVLVDTDAAGLVDRSPTFGRYFIAQAYSAGLSRGSRQGAQRRPIHVYIDECEPYLDDKIEKMLTTIRSYGVGVMMAFQGEWQMTGYERVIQGNTSIKILGHLRDVADAKMFAGNMRTSVEFLMSQRKDPDEPPQYGDFACYTADLNRTVGIRVPFHQLDARPQMSESAYLRMTDENRERVSKGQPKAAREASLDQHYSGTGSLWADLEEAAIQAGGVDAKGAFSINHLTDRLTPEQRRTFNTLRVQRNHLTHKKIQIPDLHWWQAEARALLELLTSNESNGNGATDPNWSPTL